MSIALLENPEIRRQAQPLSVSSYHRLREAGSVATKTELVEGIVVEKMSKSPLHEYIVAWLYDFFLAAVSEDYIVRKEGPLTLDFSEPAPDLSIVKGSLQDFRTEHPNSAELVVEVALTSVALDRAKVAIYASANIPWYWLVLPERQQMTIYSSPANGHYQSQKTYGPKDDVATPWGTLALQPWLS